MYFHNILHLCVVLYRRRRRRRRAHQGIVNPHANVDVLSQSTNEREKKKKQRGNCITYPATFFSLVVAYLFASNALSVIPRLEIFF